MNTLFQVLALFLSLCYFSRVDSEYPSNAQHEAFVLSQSSHCDVIQKRNKRSVQETSISSLHVTSVVMSRFARVTVVSEMENHLNESKDITFSVRLPDAAFITEFQMEVSGVTFVGKVKEKKAAKQQFDRAKESGNTAGLVTADVRETQTFNVAANVAAQSSVTFTLVYQELLKRRLGEYNHVILVNPGKVVDNLVVDVYITEKLAITSVNVRLPNSNNEGRGKGGSYGVIPVDYDIRRSKHQARITFKPTENEQRQLLLIPEDERKLTVRYDVTREVLGGEIQTRNGYFVHFFAPENLPILPKNVVFVIDRSGSMLGTKMTQTKKAFTSVLKEMRESDKFNIISFAGDVTVWNSQNLVKVDKENVQDGVDYVNRIGAGGLTNINHAMMRATELLANNQGDKLESSMIVLLTDGSPTAGVTNTDQIRLNVKEAVAGRFSVFCLGFGKYLDHQFLKRMASENDGISRQIYEDSDADLQLEGFFQEVATPLLLRFQMKYPGSEVQNVSQSKFDKYFSGSEVVVVGQVTGDDHPLRTVIKGESVEGKVKFTVESTPQDHSFQHWFRDTGDFDDFIERLWAYFTIKELLQKRDVSDSSKEISELNEKILKLAMKYSFVTPLTSMVVTLPEDEITTTAPTGSTVHPPIPPCFVRGAKIPDYLTYPTVWCPYVFSEDQVRGREASKPSTSSISFMKRPAKQRLTGGFRSSRRRRRRRYMSPSMTPRTRTTTTTVATTTTTSTTTISTIAVIPATCNKNLTESSGRMESLREVTSKTVCTWVIILNEGSWINLHLKELDTTVNKIEIWSNNSKVHSHLLGKGSEKYFLLMSNTAQIRMELYPPDNDKVPMLVTYEEYIPGVLGFPKSTELSSENVFSANVAISSTNISSSVNQTGSISSPNYPESYPSNSHSLWTFVNTDPTLQLRIAFLDMDIEMNGDGSCTHDRIVIKDGDDERDVCGYDLSDGSWSTTGEIVKIAFLSDDILETSGFKMKFEFVSLLP